MYTERSYRARMGGDAGARFNVTIGESDLDIQCGTDRSATARHRLAAIRRDLKRHIARDPLYKSSLVPVPAPADAPEIVRLMADAAALWDVGPMAAVAGAVAQLVGTAIAAPGERVVVENGGDIWARSDRELRCAIYAGERSPFRDRLAFAVDARAGVGVCTSSGVVGPSLSFGRADAVVVVASDAAVADAAATAIGNRIQGPGDVGPVVEAASAGPGLRALVACCGDRLALWGDIELVKKERN
jgi:ApbE superfamily uncharacterized protein (UPF0280 family)